MAKQYIQWDVDREGTGWRPCVYTGVEGMGVLGLASNKKCFFPSNSNQSSMGLYTCSNMGNNPGACGQRGPREGQVGSWRDVEIESLAAADPCKFWSLVASLSSQWQAFCRMYLRGEDHSLKSVYENSYLKSDVGVNFGREFIMRLTWKSDHFCTKQKKIGRKGIKTGQQRNQLHQVFF